MNPIVRNSYFESFVQEIFDTIFFRSESIITNKDMLKHYYKMREHILYHYQIVNLLVKHIIKCHCSNRNL